MLRDFQARDQCELRRLILSGLRERWGNAFDETLNTDLDDFVKNYLDRNGEVVVIERGGELIATGTLVPEGSGGRIVRMSVASRCRRQGLARRVVDELIARARQREMLDVRVLTDTPWTSAVELYRSCGFTEVGDDGTDTHFVITLQRPTNPARRY